MRFENIDLLKGLLIILVISGHVLQGGVTENIGRYIIYSFHMPIFIGISGFLFNSAKIGAISFKELVSKYLFRVIIPWAIAIVGYMIFVNGIEQLHAGLFVKSFIYPFYHLWFIPAFLSWVFITWVAEKLKITISQLLVISIIISLIFYSLLNYPATYKAIPHFNKVVDLLIKTFRPYFYVFFVFGIYLKNQQTNSKLTLNILLTLASFAGIILLFFYPNKIAGIVLIILFNLSLLRLVVAKARENFFPHIKSIQWIGVNSLGIYLWHVIPIIIITRLLGTGNLLLFYSVTVITEIAFILIMTQLTRIRFANKYFLGMG